MSVPCSVIHILTGVPVNATYENTLYFETKAEQTAYFLGKKTRTFEHYTYLRPNNVIKVAGDIVNARAWNYLMFQNDAGKWYYHFINKVVYLSDSSVELHIELDVMQTFMFDWDLGQCFIERMHTPSDEYGEHTVPEGLETGPLIRYDVADVDLGDNYIMLLMSCNANGGDAWGKMYGGVYSGLACYAVDPADVTSFNNWLMTASAEGYIDAILAMWMYPKALVTVNDADTGPLYRVSGAADHIDVVIPNKLNIVEGYWNKKTLTYPFAMLYVSNNMGGCAVYHLERFAGDEYNFKVYGALSPDSGVQLVPIDYKQIMGDTRNFEEALTLPSFPSCAWNSDTYKVWLAQNQNSIDTQIQQAKIQAVTGTLTGGASMIGGLLTANPAAVAGGGMAAAGSLLNYHNTVQSLMAQQADMAVQPDQARGNHSANINMTHHRPAFSAYFMAATHEYLQKIDDYFSRYGYKVNEVGVPPLCNRERFTYIKTVGSLVLNKPGGTMGNEDMLKIQAIFDKGVTFWVDKNNVGIYTMSNPPF